MRRARQLGFFNDTPERRVELEARPRNAGGKKRTVVGLGSHLHGLVEVGRSDGDDHELLEGERVAGVRSTVDDVEAGGGEDVRGLDAGELGEVLVEGDALLRGTEKASEPDIVSRVGDRPRDAP